MTHEVELYCRFSFKTYAIFELLTVRSIQISVVWNVTPCNMIDVYQKSEKAAIHSFR
jgi:hypothetical protein